MVLRTGNSSSSSSSGAAALYQTVMQQPVEPDDAQAACMLDLMLPDTIISILQLLAGCPQHIVSFSLASSQAYQLCSDANLWTDLCRSITDTLPAQLRSVDWSPSAWQLGSHKELYICLLHPYAPLLRQRVWHTTKMPAGQLLVVDAQPPLIVGRSVSYTKLQGDPISHALFVVRLPHTPDCGAATPPKGKGKVYCCCCAPPEHVSPEDGMHMNMARSGMFTGLCKARLLSPARLTFLQDSAAAAAAEDGGAEAADTPAGAGGAGAGSSSGPAAGTTGADGAPSTAGLYLCCSASCGNLYAELVARWRVAQPYPDQLSSTSSNSGGGVGRSSDPRSSAAADAPAGPGDAAGAPASTGSSSSSSSLPLPDVGEFRVTPWDLRWIVEELDVPQDWRSRAVHRPFLPIPWLHPAAAATTGSAAAAAAAADGAADGVTTLAARSSSSGSGGGGRLQVTASPTHQQAATASAAAAAAGPADGLTGLWRGTYGSHGVELVQLQLLAAPPGYDLLRQHGVAAAGPALSFSDCPGGVLLHSLLRTTAPTIHPSQLESMGGAGTLAGMHQPEDMDAPPEAAAAAAAEAEVDAAGSPGSAGQRLLPQQLLLVATKVTGDRNVPAGQVTFAVDLGSRSTVGAGQLLQLPASTHSDVQVNAPGTRPFYIKERYSGLSQISDVHFQSPRLIGVQLLVFEDPDCMGLLWQSPMDSFSLLSRLPALP